MCPLDGAAAARPPLKFAARHAILASSSNSSSVSSKSSSRTEVLTATWDRTLVGWLVVCLFVCLFSGLFAEVKIGNGRAMMTGLNRIQCHSDCRPHRIQKERGSK